MCPASLSEQSPPCSNLQAREGGSKHASTFLTRSLPAVRKVCGPWPSHHVGLPPEAQPGPELVLMQPAVSSQAPGSENGVLSRVLVSEHPPLQPSHPAVVVIFCRRRRRSHLSLFARQVSSVVCKAFVCEKTSLPVSTIVWIQSSHKSSAASAESAFSKFHRMVTQILVQILQEELTFC